MVKDLPKESASKRAARKWANNALSQKFKKMKATGEGAEQFRVRDGKKYFSTELKKPSKEPKPADVIENEAQHPHSFERKFLKDIRAMMNEHKAINIERYAALIDHQRRRLLKEKIRRLEASIAEREGGQNG